MQIDEQIRAHAKQSIMKYLSSFPDLANKDLQSFASTLEENCFNSSETKEDYTLRISQKLTQVMQKLQTGASRKRGAPQHGQPPAATPYAGNYQPNALQPHQPVAPPHHALQPHQPVAPPYHQTVPMAAVTQPTQQAPMHQPYPPSSDNHFGDGPNEPHLTAHDAPIEQTPALRQGQMRSLSSVQAESLGDSEARSEVPYLNNQARVAAMAAAADKIVQLLLRGKTTHAFLELFVENMHEGKDAKRFLEDAGVILPEEESGMVGLHQQQQSFKMSDVEAVARTVVKALAAGRGRVEKGQLFLLVEVMNSVPEQVVETAVAFLVHLKQATLESADGQEFVQDQSF